MPKLSRYISSATDRPSEGVSLIFNEKLRPDEFLAGPSAATLLRSTRNAVVSSNTTPASGTVPSRDRLQTAWERRAQTYGQRQYRQPDGTMSSSRPPRNPYAVASRSSWSELVRFCRQETSTSPAMMAAHQARYGGPDTKYDEHVAYLKTLGDMSPELDKDGGFLGFDEMRRKPLGDETHAFNSYFKDEAAELFRQHGSNLSL